MKHILDPLELNDNLHICLWSEGSTHKWTIAYWARDKEGYYLKFVGDRPLDERVNWTHFKMLIRFGQEVADERFKQEEEEELI